MPRRTSDPRSCELQPSCLRATNSSPNFWMTGPVQLPCKILKTSYSGAEGGRTSDSKQNMTQASALGQDIPDVNSIKPETKNEGSASQNMKSKNRKDETHSSLSIESSGKKFSTSVQLLYRCPLDLRYERGSSRFRLDLPDPASSSLQSLR